MLKRAGQHDFDTWMSLGELITKETRKKLRDAMTGSRFADLQEAQVDLIKSLPREAAEKAHEIAMKSLSNGDRYTDFVGLIEKLGPIAESRAICIARTETARARTSYTQARAEAVGSTHYIWHCVHDGATRDRHRELDGTIQSWADPPITSEPGQKEIRSGPGQSFNCFTGDTLVRLDDDFLSVIRAPFNGSVIDIGTSGSRVTATPNHPMLTNRGWVAAGEIHEGDYLLQPLGDTTEGVKPNENRGHTRIADLYDAFSAEVKRTPGALFDFYGDLPDGDVDTAIIQRGLGVDGIAERLKGLGYLKLTRPTAVMPGVRHDRSDMSFSGVGGESPALFERSPGHSDVHGLAGVADGDVMFFEASGDGLSVNTERLGQGEHRFPREISADQLGVIKFVPVMSFMSLALVRGVDPKSSKLMGKHVRRNVDFGSGIFNKGPTLYKGFRVKNLLHRKFLGHVYTLHTVKNWYCTTLDNYISRNCRCYAEPLFEKSKYED